VWLSDLRWTTPRLFTVLSMAQVAFHGLLVLLTPAAGVHGSMSTMAGTHGSPMAMSHTMLLGHAFAVLVNTVVLGRGERWAWTLVQLLTLWLPRIGARVSVAPRSDVITPPTRSWLPTRRGLLLATARSRRGPPRLLAT
jgi:hypothetical protein